MKKMAFVSMAVPVLLLAATAGTQANSSRVTRGDAEAIFQAFTNGGWSILLNGQDVSEGAPADFMPDSIARIAPNQPFNGRRYCALDWHVISSALNEGNPAGGTRTNDELRSYLMNTSLVMTLDGAPLDIERTAVKRTTNPERIGAVEAFSLQAGKVVGPDELSVGAHTLQVTAQRPSQPVVVMRPITFFVDAAGTGACV